MQAQNTLKATAITIVPAQLTQSRVKPIRIPTILASAKNSFFARQNNFSFFIFNFSLYRFLLLIFKFEPCRGIEPRLAPLQG